MAESETALEISMSSETDVHLNYTYVTKYNGPTNALVYNKTLI
jgi:hypothetical protein